MTGLPWYAHSISSYETDTMHLSMLEHGAYRLMMDHYYKLAAPLPVKAEQVFRVCRAVDDQEKGAVTAVLEQFFELKPDGWHNGYADRELAKMAEISGKRSVAGKKGQQARSKPEANASAIAENSGSKSQANAEQVLATLNTRQDISSLRSDISPRRAAPRDDEPDGFPEFYDSFPLHKGRAAAVKAYVSAIKGGASAADILAGTRRYAADRQGQDPKFTKHPATWLNKGCWTDEEVSRETFGNAGRTASALDNTLAGIELALAADGGEADGPAPAPGDDQGPTVALMARDGGQGVDIEPAAVSGGSDSKGVGKPLCDAGAGLPAGKCEPRAGELEIPAFLLRSRRSTWASNSRGLAALSAGAEPGREAEVLSPSVADPSHV